MCNPSRLKVGSDPADRIAHSFRSSFILIYQRNLKDTFSSKIHSEMKPTQRNLNDTFGLRPSHPYRRKFRDRYAVFDFYFTLSYQYQQLTSWDVCPFPYLLLNQISLLTPYTSMQNSVQTTRQKCLRTLQLLSLSLFHLPPLKWPTYRGASFSTYLPTHIYFDFQLVSFNTKLPSHRGVIDFMTMGFACSDNFASLDICFDSVFTFLNVYSPNYVCQAMSYIFILKLVEWKWKCVCSLYLLITIINNKANWTGLVLSAWVCVRPQNLTFIMVIRFGTLAVGCS